jgi:hypothetical protein
VETRFCRNDRFAASEENLFAVLAPCAHTPFLSNIERQDMRVVDLVLFIVGFGRRQR